MSRLTSIISRPWRPSLFCRAFTHTTLTIPHRLIVSDGSRTRMAAIFSRQISSMDTPKRMPGPQVELAIVGVGLVGGELINQLLSLPSPSPFRILSLTSSSRSLFDLSGLDLSKDTWKSALSASSTPADLNALLGILSPVANKKTNRVVLVDNTSSEDVARAYPEFLKAGIDVVTPNKKAFSGEQTVYDEMMSASAGAGSRVLNEATVGAGLPIISTLKDLVITGDKITKIEGVFSGTMSYIFNNFSTAQHGGPSFSSVVTVAREKGFTEPHPGDDLNGADVARKLAILARNIHAFQNALPKGFLSVKTTSLVPSQLESTTLNGDAFLSRLPEFDADFDSMRAEASEKGEVLRYVGVIDSLSGEIKASLERYPKTHAFATSLGGSDNIVMFHTERYGTRPLIVQGAGAGAAVTAMGVLSDLFKLV